MPDWLEDASANRHIKTYVKDFLDVSGNLTVRNNNEEYAWNSYGQVLSGVYESDNKVQFGITVDMDDSGTTIVVGASKDNIGADEDGALYVYRYDTTAEIWYQLGNTITESSGPNTGRLVKISDNGNRIAYGSDTADEGYIYDYNSSTNTWDSAGYILITPDVSHVGGFELSGDGNTIFFGDHTDGTYGSNTGTLVVYRNTSGTTWTQIGKLSSDNLGLVNSHTWGLGISYNGNRLLIGAPFYDDADGNADSGLFWVLDYTGDGTASTDNSDWSQVGSTIYGSPAERLGVAGDMSSDGSIIVVSSNNVTPSAYVYQYDATVSGSWKLLGTPIRVLNTPHGACLSNDGTILLVNDRDDSTTGTGNGALYIYKYIDNDWVQQGSTIYGSYTSSNWGQDYGTGMAINADGTKVVAGGYTADLNTTDSGAVHAWQWSQKAYTNPTFDISGGVVTFGKDINKDDPNYYKVVQLRDNTNTFGELYGGTTTENFGTTLAMNEDGYIMIVGAPLGDESASDDGYARVFKWRNGQWGQMGNYISPSSTNSYRTGASVDMNDVGNIVLVGALAENSVGSISAYEFINGDWSLKGSEIKGHSSNDNFGYEGCAMDGTGNIIAGMDIVGNVKVYQYVEANSDWSQLGSTISVSSGAIDYGSKRIDLNQDGTIIVVGDVYDDTTGTNNGRLSVYKFTGDVSDGSWNLIGNHITITTSSSFPQNDHFGRSVSINSDGTIVGGTSIYYNSEEGRAFIYKYSEDAGDWVQLGTDIGDRQMVDTATTYNARGMALSGDGKTVTIGDSHDSTVHSYNGAINVFKYANGDWVWVGKIYGGRQNCYLRSCCISRDGKRFAGGSGSDDTIATNSGVVIAGEIVNFLDGAAMKIENGTMHVGTNAMHLGRNVTIGKINDGYTGYSSTEGDVPLINYQKVNKLNSATTFEVQSVHVQDMQPEDDIGMITASYWLQRRLVDGKPEYTQQVYELVEHDDIVPGTNSRSRYHIVVRDNDTWRDFKFRGSDGYFETPVGYSTLSDDRLKKNESFITNATETIMKLSPQKYEKYHNFDCSGSDYNIESGLIAQDIWYNAPELRDMVLIENDNSGNISVPLPLPEGVDTTHDIQNDPDYTSLGWTDKPASISYEKLIPYLIKSNQEQQEIIDAEKEKKIILDTKNANLEQEITTLETQLTDILTRLSTLESA